MSYANLTLYGAVIPSYDSKDKKGYEQPKEADVNTMDGWNKVLDVARRMK